MNKIKCKNSSILTLESEKCVMFLNNFKDISFPFWIQSNKYSSQRIIYYYKINEWLKDSLSITKNKKPHTLKEQVSKPS